MYIICAAGHVSRDVGKDDVEIVSGLGRVRVGRN